MKKLALVFSFCSLLCAAQIPSNVPTNGLMGYWPFSGNANDMSINAYHGTVYGAQLATDRFNSAASSYSFNGTSNYILTPYQGILGSNSRAVSFWAKTTTTNNVITGVSWGSNTSGNRFGCGFNYVGNGATIGIANGAMTYTTPVPVSDNQWHHYVFQFSGSTLNQVQIYQDATLLTQTLSVFNPSTTINTLQGFNVQFGRVDYSPSPDYFRGQLDDIGFWNRTLTQTEINLLYTGSEVSVNEFELSEELKLNIYPNPASETIFVQSNKTVEIEIYNILGQKVFSSDNCTVINCKELERGVYFVLASAKNESICKKIILTE